MPERGDSGKGAIYLFSSDERFDKVQLGLTRLPIHLPDLWRRADFKEVHEQRNQVSCDFPNVPLEIADELREVFRREMSMANIDSLPPFVKG